MRELYFLAWLILLSITDKANGQSAPQLQWALSAGNTTPNAGEIRSNDITVDAVGNRYIVGSFELTADFDPSPSIFNLTATYFDLQNSSDSGDVFFAKYDPNGNLIWAKTIGGPDSFYGDDDGLSIHLDNSGNIILMGTLGSDFDFDPSEGEVILESGGGSDSFIAKYDTNGNYIWAVAIPDYNYEAVGAVATDYLGNIYIAGSGIDISYFAKYNSSGVEVWKKILSNTGIPNFADLTITSTNQILLTGTFSGTIDFDPSPATANLTAQAIDGSDGFVAKYDTNGNYLWAKDIGGNNGTVRPGAIALGQNGEIHCIGIFTGIVDFDPSPATNTISGTSNQNYFIAKYDADANYVWTKALINVGEPYSNNFRNISIGSGGTIYISGNFKNTVDFDPAITTANLTALGGNDIYIAKYDSTGNYLWAKTVSGLNDENIAAMALDSAGNLNCTGNLSGTVDFDPSATVQGLTSVGDFDVFIAKYTSEGAFLNAGLIGGYPTSTGSEDQNKMALGPNGTIYTAGTFSQTVDFDPSPATANLSSQIADIFIAKYSENGNYVWAKSIQGIAIDALQLTAMTTDGNGNLYIAGYFHGSMDFDPSDNTAALTSGDPSVLFIAKYNSNGNYLWAKPIRKTSNETGLNYINSIASDTNGALYITGHYEGNLDFDPSPTNVVLSAVNYSDIFIAKYDTDGNYIWAKTIGGNWYDKSNAIQVNNLGEVYITGDFGDTVDFDPSPAVTNLVSLGGQDSIYFAKYDTNGNYLWAKGINSDFAIHSRTITVGPNNQIYLSGYFYGTADFDPSDGISIQTSSDGLTNYIAKYNANGDYLWMKPITGKSATINTTSLDNTENLYIAGNYGPDYNQTGNTINLDLNDPNATFTTIGRKDLFIAKYDTNGNYLWGRSAGGPLDENISSLKINQNNELVVAGSFMLTTDFDFSSGTSNLTSINYADMFIAKYKECSPNVVAVTLAGSTLTVNTPADSYQWIDCNNNNSPITGATTASFTPTVSGNYAAIITINGCSSTSNCQSLLSVNSALAQATRLYPNPSNGIFKVTLPRVFEKTSVQVFDLTGKSIKELNLNSQQEFDVQLQSVANGIYFVQLNCDDETATFKVIKN